MRTSAYLFDVPDNCSLCRHQVRLLGEDGTIVVVPRTPQNAGTNRASLVCFACLKRRRKHTSTKQDLTRVAYPRNDARRVPDAQRLHRPQPPLATELRSGTTRARS